MPFNRIQFIAPIPGQEGYQDYLEGRGRLGEAGEIDRSTETVIIGQQCLLAPYKASERYQGRILHPERRGEEWSFQANMLFFAGVITAKRSVFLIPSPSRDTRYTSGGIIYPETFTTDELLWLKDNDYTFESSFQDGLDPTTKAQVQGILATPPPVLARTRAPIPIFRNYQIDKTLSKSSQDIILKAKLEKLKNIDIYTGPTASTQHSITQFFTDSFNKIEATLGDEEAFVEKFVAPSPERTPLRPEKEPTSYDSPATAAALAGLRLISNKTEYRKRRLLSSFEDKNRENDEELSPGPKKRRTSGGSSRLLGGRSSRFLGGSSPRLLTERPDGTTPPPKVPTTLMSLSSIEQRYTWGLAPDRK